MPEMLKKKSKIKHARKHGFLGRLKTRTGKTSVFIDKATGDLAKPGQTDNVEAQSHIVIKDATGEQYCVDCPHPDQQPSPTPNP